MVGKKPIPDHIKQKRGTLQPCRKRGSLNISTSETIPDPPEEFNKLEKQIYYDTASELFNNGLFQKIGIPPLLMYCSYMATAIDAENKCRANGRVYIYKNKYGEKMPKVNPYHRVSIEAFQAARQLMSEYGITPSAQARLAAAKSDDTQENPFIKLMDE